MRGGTVSAVIGGCKKKKAQMKNGSINSRSSNHDNLEVGYVR